MVNSKTVMLVLAIMVMTVFLFSCTQSNTTDQTVSTIDVSLDKDSYTLEDRVTVEIETDDVVYSNCNYYIVKPNNNEVLFSSGNNCGRLIFNPQNMPLLFDQGNGNYRFKVVGYQQDRIAGMGLAQFTFSKE